MARWDETNTANKRDGHCEFCGTTIAAGTGLLIWHYGEQDFEDEDSSAKARPKIWGVRCTDTASCARRAEMAAGRLRVNALREKLNNLSYGDWDAGERQSVRADLQQKLDTATQRLAELDAAQ